MKKGLKILLLIILPCFAFMLSACGSKYVTDIVQTNDGDNTNFTIIYSDGTNANFAAKNGKDGQNGQDLNILSIFEYCQSIGLYADYEDEQQAFLAFMQDYMSINNTTSLTASIAKSLQSTVDIYTAFNVKANYYSIYCGAGVIYKINENKSYILTNYHVVYEKDLGISTDIVAFQYGVNDDLHEKVSENSKYSQYYTSYDFSNGVSCQYVGGSMMYDVAILEVSTNELKQKNPTVREVEIANSYTVGQTCYAIGNPEGNGMSATVGVVSKVSENIIMKSADEESNLLHRVLRTDVAINGGNSGGGLFNANGELIGIVNAKTISTKIENIAYALPVDFVTKVADNLIYYHQLENSVSQVHTLNLGITTYNSDSTQIYDPASGTTTIKDNALVTQVKIGYMGYQLGIAVGDIITAIKINGITYDIEREFMLEDYLLTIRPGDTLSVIIKRNAKYYELTYINILTLNAIQYSNLSVIK